MFCKLQYLIGNDDQSRILYHGLEPPIVAKSIRFIIVDYHKKNNSESNYIGMRTELYGCPLSVPKIIQPHQ